MSWELHGSDGHFEVQDMDESRRVALIRFATLEEAQLMTAAPKMLEALRLAERRLSKLANDMHPPDVVALKIIRSAIAKTKTT